MCHNLVEQLGLLKFIIHVIGILEIRRISLVCSFVTPDFISSLKIQTIEIIFWE